MSVKALALVLACCAAAVTALTIHTDADASLQADTRVGGGRIAAPLATCGKLGFQALLPGPRKDQVNRCEVCKTALAEIIAVVHHRKTPDLTPVATKCKAMLLGKPAGPQSEEQCERIVQELLQRSVELQSLTNADRGGVGKDDDRKMGLSYSTYLCSKDVLACCGNSVAAPADNGGRGGMRTSPFAYAPYRNVRAQFRFVLGEPKIRQFNLAPVSLLKTDAQKRRVQTVLNGFNNHHNHLFTLSQAATHSETLLQHELPFPVTVDYTGQTLKFKAPSPAMDPNSPCEPKDLYGASFEYWERILYLWDFNLPAPADDKARTEMQTEALKKMASGEGGFDEPWKDRFWFSSGYVPGVGCKRSGTEAMWANLASAAQNGAIDFTGGAGASYKFDATTATSFTIGQVDRPGTSVANGDKTVRFLRRDLYFGWTLRKPDGTKIEKAGIQSIEIEESLPIKIKFVTADAPRRPIDLDVPSDIKGHDDLQRVKTADADVNQFISKIGHPKLLSFEYLKRLPKGSGEAMKNWLSALRQGKETNTGAFVDGERDWLDALDAKCQELLTPLVRGQPGTPFSNYLTLPVPYWNGQHYIQKSCGEHCLLVALIRPKDGPPVNGLRPHHIDRAFVTDGHFVEISPELHNRPACKSAFKGRQWHETPVDLWG